MWMPTTGATPAFAQPVSCYSVRPGDTAARLALRLTGDARNRRQPGFQILNPETAALIPKSRYGAIQSGWHVCVATGMLRDGFAQPRVELASAPTLLPQNDVTQGQTEIEASALWWGTFLLAVSGPLLGWVVAATYLANRRERLEAMRRFGNRFVLEFERPLFRKRAAESAVKSRLRFAPSRHRLEILLAPADGRTYPNLFDHRKNLEYDVARVLRLFSDPPVTGSLRAEGPWVVIPFRFENQ